MYLIIDTTDSEEIFLGLADEEDIVSNKKISAKFEQEEKLLQGIENFLKKYDINKEELKGIIAVTGPGSFSSLRIGITVANTLAWVLHIPIQGFDKSHFINYEELIKISLHKFKNHKEFKIIAPTYGKEPNINI